MAVVLFPIICHDNQTNDRRCEKNGPETVTMVSEYLIYYMFPTEKQNLNSHSLHWQQIHFKYSKGYKWQGLRNLLYSVDSRVLS